MTRIATLFAAAGALALAACSQTAETQTETDAATTPATAATTAQTPASPAAEGAVATFLTDAQKGDNSEVRVGTLASDKASSADVKAYAQMLVTEHGAHKDKVLAVATPMNVAETDSLTPEGEALAGKLDGLSGEAFDTAFLDGMIASHTKNIAKYEAQAKAGGPAEVTKLAEETLPVLRKHLAEAKRLREAM